MAFQVYDVVVVVEGPRVYRCEVTKVARRYVTVVGSSRSWDFDKETRSHRGDHGGHMPNLYTPREHERLVAWDDFQREFRSLPYSSPARPRSTTWKRSRQQCAGGPPQPKRPRLNRRAGDREFFCSYHAVEPDDVPLSETEPQGAPHECRHTHITVLFGGVQLCNLCGLSDLGNLKGGFWRFAPKPEGE